MAAQHLQPLMADSILRQHERGLRRYFPLKAKSRKNLKYLREAFFIVYGREPKSNEDIFQAMFYHSFDKYVERFDGKLWVRTVAREDFYNPKSIERKLLEEGIMEEQWEFLNDVKPDIY